MLLLLLISLHSFKSLQLLLIVCSASEVLFALNDFEKIAEAYGLDYFHLEHNDEMEQRIDEFLACDHAAMMVCEVYSFDLVKE